MKKTTKFLLVLAAVVAMTIGAVSTVMAADDVVIDPSTWSCTDGWAAKDTKGNKITTGWAVDPDGHWYYFENGYALENNFIVWKGNVYYFGADAIMCEGWVKFSASNDLNFNVVMGVDRDGKCDDKTIFDGDRNNPYGKEVWMFFEKGGTAASHEWICSNGLWYYFEEEIMVCSTYAYFVDADNKFYGFSGDGNMHVGWVEATRAYNSNTPYEGTAKCWLYYRADGEMVDAGWEKINDTWYWFAQNTAASVFTTGNYKIDQDATILVTNTFANIDGNVAGNYYYFDGTGAMQTNGEFTIAKSAAICTSEAEFLAEGVTNNADGRWTGGARTYLIDKNGVVKTKNQGSCFYLRQNEAQAYALNPSKCPYDVKNHIATAITLVKEDMPGQKVYNTFWVENNQKVHFYDASGNMVKNTVVTFGEVTIAFDSNGNALTPNTYGTPVVDDGETAKYCGGRYYYFSNDFGTITVGGVTIPGCSVRKLSAVSGSAIDR